MRVFLLRADANTYQNLGFTNEKDLAAALAGFDGRPMRATWRPLRVAVLEGEKLQPSSDYPSLSPIPVFSQRAFGALKDVLATVGELLPLDCEEGEYMCLNVTRVIPALDLDRAVVKHFPDSQRILRIVEYAFLEDPLRGETIFKIPEMRAEIFATDQFEERIRSADLVGFALRPVWDSREGSLETRAAEVLRHEPISGAEPVAERALSKEEMREIRNYVAKGLELINGDSSAASPTEIVTHIRIAIDKHRGKALSAKRAEELAFCFGCLWGEMVVRELGWDWAAVSLEGQECYGVVSPKRECMVLPLHMIKEQLSEGMRENTSLLLFNILRAGQDPEAKPGSYLLIR